jgi:hypothetical protein
MTVDEFVKEVINHVPVVSCPSSVVSSVVSCHLAGRY